MADYGALLGSGGLIACPSNTAYDFGKGDFTVTALVKANAPGVVVSCKGPQGPGWLLWIQASGIITFTTDNGVGYYEAITNPTEVLDNYWHHIAAVRQSGQLTIYLDGGQVQAGVRVTQPTPVDVSNQIRLLMGNTDQAMNRQFIGLLEDVTIWDRALTTDELIPTRYNLLTGHERGLVGYWAMDENLTDQSPTANNGTSTGAVSFVQIFHCDDASGDNHYEYIGMRNQGVAAGERGAVNAAAVTRHQEFDVVARTPGLFGALVTAVGDFTFPAGAVLTVTDPAGTSYNGSRNDATAYVEMAGNSIRLIAVNHPMPGTWVIEVTAPGNVTFQLLLQTVPSSAIADTIEDVLKPIYGPRHQDRKRTEAGVPAWGWAGMAAATIGLGLLTIATLGATAPVLAGVIAAVAVTDTAIVVAAAQQLPNDQGDHVYVDAGANMGQFGVANNVVIRADANNDEATRYLYEQRVEYYGYLTSTDFKRVRLVKSKFTNATVNAALQEPGVRFFTCSAHGQNSYLLGGDGKEVLWVGRYPAAAASGKVFHLLACRTGKNLGLDLVKNGATAFFGYTLPFVVLIREREAFVWCDLRVDYQLTQGKTTGVAQDVAVATFKEKIKLFEDAGKHNAAVILQQDLDIFVGPRDAGYGDPNALIV